MSERQPMPQGRLTFSTLLAAAVILLPAAAWNINPSPAFEQEATVEAPEIFSEAKMAISQGKLVKSTMHGQGQIQKSFSDCSASGAILTGFEVGLGKVGKNPDLIYALRPIYRTENGEVYFQEFGLFKDKNLPGKKVIKSKVTLVAQLKARPGYAVGAIHVRAGKSMHALSLTYMRITGTNLDPRQSYSSHWYGNPTLGKEATIGGNGAPLVGLFGNQNDQQVLALGVFQMQPPIIATNPLAARWPVASPPPYDLQFRASNNGEKTSILVPVQPPEEFAASGGRIDRTNKLPADLSVSLDPVGRCKFPPPVQPKTENTVAEEEPIAAPPSEEVAEGNLAWLPLFIFAVITILGVVFFLKHAKAKQNPEIPRPKRPDTNIILTSALGSLMQPTEPRQPSGDVSPLLSKAISQPSGQPAPPGSEHR